FAYAWALAGGRDPDELDPDETAAVLAGSASG
ncbi:MAG: hypothetical protein QOG11_168, partial [Solirubrobacteraceae bacterium]|nr:hypothetical protein [Solirubrobacteraceae bacterium]